MQLKTGLIIALALGLSGCASSPFMVSKKGSYAPGFVPRNELGNPVLPDSAPKAKSGTDDGAESRAVARRTPASWING
ncbi:hypothetical protein [Pedomonas sp. V897]|uniref:hypothetical protein n=1 Tax=Pedomonas sp. V897 TaxID=3446482 RepID=UPI003EDEF90E